MTTAFIRLVGSALTLLASVAVAAPDQAGLVQIARSAAKRERIRLADARPPVVIDQGKTWIVILDPPPRGWKGGGVEVSIDKKSRRVLRVEGTK